MQRGEIWDHVHTRSFSSFVLALVMNIPQFPPIRIATNIMTWEWDALFKSPLPSDNDGPVAYRRETIRSYGKGTFGGSHGS